MAVLNNGSGPAVKRIIGRKLQRGLGLISRDFRAVLAAGYVAGGISLTHGSPRQAAFLFDVPMSDVRAILRATPLEVEAIKRKRLTIEELRRQQRRNHRPSDAYSTGSSIGSAAVCLLHSTVPPSQSPA